MVKRSGDTILGPLVLSGYFELPTNNYLVVVMFAGGNGNQSLKSYSSVLARWEVLQTSPWKVGEILLVYDLAGSARQGSIALHGSGPCGE